VLGFKLAVEPPKPGTILPVRSINELQPGAKLKYEPVKVPKEDRSKGRIALILARSGSRGGQEDVKVLEAFPVDKPAEWQVPIRSSIVGLVYGPHGLNIKNVNQLVEKKPEVVDELAAYAQHSTEVEALVQTLSAYEQSPSGSTDLNAALQGFSSRFSVPVPKLDTSASSNQQAATLLQAVVPTLSSYDPLASSRSQMVQQSVGVAAAVAELFFGSPVGLAVGGAALVENMRTLAFPGTDFRSAFAQSATGSEVELCAKQQPPKPRTRPAYLWMLNIPDVPPPSLSLEGAPVRLGLGDKAEVKVASAHVKELPLALRARNWRLVNGSESTTIPVTIEVQSAGDRFELDLKQAKLSPGQYRLAADWDWTPFDVAGTLDFRPFADFGSVKIAPGSADRLIANSGYVKATFTGADFEFVKKVTLAGDDGDPEEVAFALPPGNGSFPDVLEAKLDTSGRSPGAYHLELTQTNDQTQSVPVIIHSPNPEITNLPVRANLGEKSQTVELKGSQLELIDKITTSGASWDLAAVAAGTTNLKTREATIKLGPDVHAGDHLGAKLTVTAIQAPLSIAEAITVVGPRPRIVRVQTFYSHEAELSLRPGELPADLAVSFSIQTENAGAQPFLQLGCRNPSDTLTALTLRPDGGDSRARLNVAGDNTLFLSLAPSTVGRSGCELAATLTAPESGASDPAALGRVLRLPHIDKFVLTDRKLEGKLYAGSLTGQDLQLIDKTGWNGKAGFPVAGVPTPVATDPAKQTLDIQLPWPPPSPQAPLYIWLRGENEARQTDSRY
jgi:hypothetical protein